MKITLIDWLKEQKLKEHKSSKSEIAQLFKVIDRDLKDAKIEALSNDRRFMTAYNAGLQLATIVLRIYGLRVNQNKAGHHRITLDALPEILGSKFHDISNYLNACRAKRNVCDYTNSGEVSNTEVSEIIMEVHKFKIEVVEWIELNHSHFLK